MIEDATHVDRAAPAFASGTIGKVPAERQRVPVVDTEHDGIGIFLAGRPGDAVDGCVRAEQDHLRPGSWQHAGQGIADQVVDLQDGEHDAHAVESRRDSTQAIGEVAHVRSLPRLQPGDLGWGSEVDAPFEITHRRPTQCQQHLRCIFHIDAVVVERGQCPVAELDRVCRSRGAELVEVRPVVGVGRRAHVVFDLVREEMDLDDLRGARYPLGLGEGDRVDGMTGWAPQLQSDVAHQLRGDRSQVVRPIARSVIDGVAVDHRADRITAAEIVEGEVHDGAGLGLLDGVAEAMCQPGADQILHDVLLQRGPADVRAEM